MCTDGSHSASSCLSHIWRSSRNGACCLERIGHLKLVMGVFFYLNLRFFTLPFDFVDLVYQSSSPSSLYMYMGDIISQAIRESSPLAKEKATAKKCTKVCALSIIGKSLPPTPQKLIADANAKDAPYAALLRYQKRRDSKPTLALKPNLREPEALPAPHHGRPPCILPGATTAEATMGRRPAVTGRSRFNSNLGLDGQDPLVLEQLRS